MHIDLSTIPHTFDEKPLLFAGGAMEYYHLRKSGDDIDFLVSLSDYHQLRAKYPENVIPSSAHDRGISVGPYEFWAESFGYTYTEMKNNAQDTPDGYMVISRRNLITLKALNIESQKAQRDIVLLARCLREYKAKERA